MRATVLRRLAAVFALLLAAAGLPSVAAAEPAHMCLSGTSVRHQCAEGALADGTPYRFVRPAQWNGIVLVDLDFASRAPDDALARRLIELGYAVGGTSRTVTGWDIAAAIDNQAAALDRFEAAFGDARWAIASGRSMGGMVSAGVAQVHPDRFAAAVPFCGGLGGAVGQWNQKLDTVFTLKTLLFSDTSLPVTGIAADVARAQRAWLAAVGAAQRTPGGRARIALAAAIGQLPAWGLTAEGEPTPQPDARDPEALQEGMYLALSGGALPYLGQAMSSRRAIEQLTGGNPSWNTGVDYARQLALAEPAHRRAVRELYARAGLDLAADLRVLAGAPRIRPDRHAVSTLEQGIVFDGDLRIPVLTVNPVGDQISTMAQQQSYGAVVREEGNAALLRQTYLGTAGHCTFTTAEQEAAIVAMAHRLRTGHWGPTNAEAMNRLAGSDRYLGYRPPVFNRPYYGEENR
ncbi:hypothetical protein [Prauserella sp. PE36]|uniref:hypothetical protein n=1 Tax=Prauserella sp. PE36 TaxID=1504709 RepID=UPI001F366189|nr:hypothetical protein [Prauserella sp. PE36]